MLAYHLLTAIEKTLLDQGIHTSWPTVRDTLKPHQVCTIVLPTDNGSILRIRKAATPEPDAQEIYRRLAVFPQSSSPNTWSHQNSDEQNTYLVEVKQLRLAKCGSWASAGDHGACPACVDGHA